MNMVFKRIIASLVLFVLVANIHVFAMASEVKSEIDIALEGGGTKSNPYLIQSVEDLYLFRQYVNGGVDFSGEYILQTQNIDLENVPYEPIGMNGHAFYGVYDGGGHFIENLYIYYRDGQANLNGFFGILGGVVVNLGIESGLIDGDYCGSIASIAVGNDAAIINCYSKASVYGTRAGGIADTFGGGNVIACCWFDGTTHGVTHAGTLSWGGDVKLYHVYTTEEVLTATSDVHSATSSKINRDILYSESFVHKLNLSAGLTQYLFAANKEVDVMQWALDESGDVVFSDKTEYIRAFGFVNFYLIPIILAMIISRYVVAFIRAGRTAIWRKYHKDIKAIAIISTVVLVFIITALIGKGREYLSLGNMLLLLLCGILHWGSIYLIIKNASLKINITWNVIPITIAIIVIAVLEAFQFDLVPRYDAQLYYGSLVKAIDLFRVDLLTYIGAFVTWKWTHGLVLLIAPLEFLMPGRMIGMYISNMVINAITMGCMYWLLRQISPKITTVMAALGSAILILCPYQLGMFTYLCMDSHTALFLVWLLCSYKKKNHIMIAFCGYLLAFNKISGLVFYVFFLITMGVFESLQTPGKNLIFKIINWWDWKKVCLWILPAILFLLTMIVGDDFIIQNFYGSYTEAKYGLKVPNELLNTVLQGGVYGLRWLFVLLIGLATVVAVINKVRLDDMLTEDGVQLITGAFFGCLGVMLILFLYQGDADCPRYTALLNLFYALSFPIAVQIIWNNIKANTLVMCTMATLLLIQTYWTIDPVMLLTSDQIDTGKKTMYKVALAGDSRPGMNIGKDYGPGYEVVGDLYAYNLEYSFYDDLLDQALTAIQPEEDDQFVLLDVMWYELHLWGNKYDIYWNTRTNSRTYDGTDPDSILLNRQWDVFTTDIVNGNFAFESKFYMIVPARVDATAALEAIQNQGYVMFTEVHPENVYGKMSVYGFEKNI